MSFLMYCDGNSSVTNYGKRTNVGRDLVLWIVVDWMLRYGRGTQMNAGERKF